MDALNKEFVRLLDNSGWHQARAARELKTTTATVSRYVNGKMRPRKQVVAHLAHLTGQVANFPDAGVATSPGSQPQLE
ncbi:MAG: helix-turn-helix transcriptional regulator, partial [Verrucomicrobiae bacterium]|nr:helix-turn-helix transcriptional regulator [Verrucomicrobiae bacterium]